MTDSKNDVYPVIGIGPPRTGSTQLHRMLGPCSKISQTKELNFFGFQKETSSEQLRENFGELFSHSSDEGHFFSTDISPIYFAQPGACHQLKLAYPQAKIICGIRNPVDRLISQYRHHYIKHEMSIDQYLSVGLEMIDEEETDWWHPATSFKQNLYVQNLKRWQSSFPNANVHFLMFDDFKARPAEIRDRLKTFLSKDDILLPDRNDNARNASTYSSQNFREAFLNHKNGKYLKELVEDQQHGLGLLGIHVDWV